MKRFLFLLSFCICILPVVFCQTNDNPSLMRLTAHELYQKGDSLIELNKEDLAIDYLELFVDIAPETLTDEDQVNYIKSCRWLTLHNYQSYCYYKAYEYALKGIGFSEEIGNSTYLSSLYNSCGSVLAIYHDYERSEEFYHKAYDVSIENHDSVATCKVLTNLIAINCYLNKTDIARAYKAEQANYLSKDSNSIYSFQVNEALILRTQKHYQEALKMYHKIKNEAVASGSELYEWISYLGLSTLHEEMQNVDSALYYQKKVGERPFMVQTDIKLNHLKAMSRLYEQNGEYKLAVDYKNRYLNFNDSLMSTYELSRIKNVQLSYEKKKSSKEIDVLNRQASEKEHKIVVQRRITLAIVLILILVVLFLLILINQKRKLQQSYDKLFEQSLRLINIEKENKQIKQSLSEYNKEHVAESEEDVDTQRMKSKMSDKQQQALWEQILETLQKPEVFSDPDLTREKLAVLVSSNSKYVSQVVNDVYKNNFRNLINEFRVKEAQLRMLDQSTYGKLTINAISESVGYKSYTSFVSAFKEITGLSPSMYYKKIQEEQTNANTLDRNYSI